VPQATQIAPASVAPQFEQNFPLAGLPHEGHATTASAGDGGTEEAMI
jgi:hypothetical protein